MFNIFSALNTPIGFYDYIWIDVVLLKETPKAILIMFDEQKNWLPKAWIAKIKRSRTNNAIKIKISEYYWSKKFS